MNFLAFVPDEDLNKLLHARRQEFIQHLMELGYLPRANADIAKALAAFRRDYLDFGLIPNYTYSIIYDPDLQEEPDTLELTLLHKLTNLEGAFHIPSLPEIGAQNILSRVLHYRLALFGLFDAKEVEQAFSKQALDALLQLKKWLLRPDEEADLLQIVYLTGNINDLIRMLVRTDKLRQHLIYFQYNASRKPSSFVQKIAGFDDEMERERAEIITDSHASSTSFSPESGSTISSEIETTIQQTLSEDKTLFTKKVKQIEADIAQKETEIEEAAHAILGEHKKTDFSPENKRQHLRRERQEQRLEAAIEVLLEQLKGHQKDALEELSVIKKQCKEQQEKVAKLKKEQEEHSAKTVALKNLLHEYKVIQKGLLKKFRDRSTPDIQLGLTNLHDIITKRQKIIFKLEQQPRPNKNVLKINKDMIKQERERLREHIKETNTRKALSNLRKNAKRQGLIPPGENLKTADKLLKKKEKESKKTLKQAEKIAQEFIQKQAKKQAELDDYMNDSQGEIQQKVKRLRRKKRQLAGMKDGFARQLQSSMHTGWLRKHHSSIFQEGDLSILEKPEAVAYNQFLIYLIQTHQWLRGYYYGTMDGDFGAMTHTSIRDICRDVVGLHHKRILMPLRKNGQPTNTWVLNAAYFFEAIAFTLPDRKEGEKDDLIEAYKTLEKEMPLGDKSPWAMQAWEEYVAQIDSDLERGRFRRVYYGARRIGRATWNAIKRFSTWVGRLFKDHIAPIFRNLLKHLFSELREGLRTYADGMRFLFGKRLLETKGANGLIISTKYDFDFDALVTVPSGVETELLKQHAAFNRQQVANMDFTMRVTGKVLKFILFAIKTGVSWQVMAIEIAFDYRQVVRDIARKMLIRAAYHFANKLVLN